MTYDGVPQLSLIQNVTVTRGGFSDSSTAAAGGDAAVAAASTGADDR